MEDVAVGVEAGVAHSVQSVEGADILVFGELRQFRLGAAMLALASSNPLGM